MSDNVIELNTKINNVIQLQPKPTKTDIKVWQFSKDIDMLVINAIKTGIDSVEAAIVLADRLGEVIGAAYKTDRAKIFTSEENFENFVLQYATRRLTRSLDGETEE